jgi:hypothetical protein
VPRIRRKALKLFPRGSFVFTERTTSVDVSKVLEEPRGFPVTLHVGRSRGALEYTQPGKPAVEIAAAKVLELLDAENARRAADAKAPAAEREPIDVDASVLAHLRLTAKKATLVGPLGIPFAGRPRRCFETTGRHPGESLWVETETGDAAIETTVESSEPTSPPTRTYRLVDPMVALRWLRDDGQNFFPKSLVMKAGPTTSGVFDELWDRKPDSR